MDQHPVPQNISSYEFRLVGDMTLKQFFQLAGGAAAGFLIYSMPLPLLIKWPLIGICVFMGIMLAFVPVSGRPFSQWLLAFFRAIYSPTQYAWQAAPEIEPVTVEPVIATTTPAKQNPLDMLETQIFSRVTQLFNQSHTAPVATTPTVASPVPPVVAPQPEVPVRVIQAVPVEETRTTQVSQVSTLKPSTPVQVEIPANSPPAVAAQPTAPQPVVPTTPVRLTPQIGHTPVSGTAPVATSTTITPSTYPNIIVGMVVNSTGQSVEGAILEISDARTGIPARALKSNKLGQFQTATPLAAGQYTILVEKDGLTFNPLSLTMENKIMQPLLISAQ
jgi:hypothetical protein